MSNATSQDISYKTTNKLINLIAGTNVTLRWKKVHGIYFKSGIINYFFYDNWCYLIKKNNYKFLIVS